MSKILGIDIGSLTIKAAAYDPLSGKPDLIIRILDGIG